MTAPCTIQGQTTISSWHTTGIGGNNNPAKHGFGKSMNSRNLLLGLLIAALLAGCVDVRPLIGAEQIPADQRVYLVEKSTFVNIAKVDQAHNGVGIVGKFEIRPGLHRIKFLGMTNGYMVGTTIVEFAHSYDFQPGHTYEIRNAPGGPFAIKVVDQQTEVELVPVASGE